MSWTSSVSGCICRISAICTLQLYKHSPTVWATVRRWSWSTNPEDWRGCFTSWWLQTRLEFSPLQSTVWPKWLRAVSITTFSSDLKENHWCFKLFVFLVGSNSWEPPAAPWGGNRKSSCRASVCGRHRREKVRLSGRGRHELSPGQQRHL